MGWKANKTFASLVDDLLPIDRLATEMVDDVSDFMLDRVKLYTPVYVPPPNVEIDAFIRDERARRVPGTLKASWFQEPIKIEGAVIGRTVTSDDPVAPHVEYLTMPHIIQPKKPGGALRFRNTKTGEVIFAKYVVHPGSLGAHMMLRASADTEVEWRRIAERVWDRWASHH